jgi:hypothetical protein
MLVEMENEVDRQVLEQDQDDEPRQVVNHELAETLYAHQNWSNDEQRGGDERAV